MKKKPEMTTKTTEDKVKKNVCLKIIATTNYKKEVPLITTANEDNDDDIHV